MTRVAVIGSRLFPDLEAVRTYVHALPRGTVVVSGHAPGVDQEAEYSAMEVGLAVTSYCADWKKYGKAAGPMRNSAIVAHCDRVAAFYCPPNREDLVSEDLTGQKFERLLVIRQVGRRLKHMFYLCMCDCGEERVVCGSKLKNGHTKSCGCIRIGRPSSQRKAPGESMRNRILDTYKRNARRKNALWQLTNEQAFTMFAAPCHYCGAAPTLTVACKGHYGAFTYNGIDRVINTDGYTAKNTVPCCTECNFRKGSASGSDFLAWVQRIADHRLVQDTLIKAKQAGLPIELVVCRRRPIGGRVWDGKTPQKPRYRPEQLAPQRSTYQKPDLGPDVAWWEQDAPQKTAFRRRPK